MVRVETVERDLYVILLNALRACFVIKDERVALIECGFPAEYSELVEGLKMLGLTPSDLDVLALTHIHVDHAGCAGYLTAEHPELEVFVHAAGLAHLVEPGRLNTSVRKAYGDRFQHVGTLRPVASSPEKHRAVRSGDVIPLGRRRLEVLETPGHARHHVVFYDTARRCGFVGDALGSKYSGLPNFVLAPPPDYDPQQSKDSIDRIRDLGLRVLYFTHNGPYYLAEKDDFFDRLKRQHDEWTRAMVQVLVEHPAGEPRVLLDPFLDRLPYLRRYPTQRFSFGLSVAGMAAHLRRRR